MEFENIIIDFIIPLLGPFVSFLIFWQIWSFNNKTEEKKEIQKTEEKKYKEIKHQIKQDAKSLCNDFIEILNQEQINDKFNLQKKINKNFKKYSNKIAKLENDVFFEDVYQKDKKSLDYWLVLIFELEYRLEETLRRFKDNELSIQFKKTLEILLRKQLLLIDKRTIDSFLKYSEVPYQILKFPK